MAETASTAKTRYLTELPWILIRGSSGFYWSADAGTGEDSQKPKNFLARRNGSSGKSVYSCREIDGGKLFPRRYGALEHNCRFTLEKRHLAQKAPKKDSGHAILRKGKRSRDILPFVRDVFRDIPQRAIQYLT